MDYKIVSRVKKQGIFCETRYDVFSKTAEETEWTHEKTWDDLFLVWDYLKECEVGHLEIEEEEYEEDG